MMLKRASTESKPSARARLVRASVATLAAASAIVALATGCLDRDVVKASPKTSNVFVSQIIQTSVDKIDLLFMVDNSASMADKQEILRDAVPVLVNRLISPICVDAMGAPTGSADVKGVCAKGAPEFSPIGDIHIGIVSSSLGVHGGVGQACPATVPDSDDKAHLIGTVRPTVFPASKTWNGSGFLAWDPQGTRNTPPGEANAANLTKTFQDMIASVAERGCGYEAQLEAWYRFLIDPEPPMTVVKDTTAGSPTNNQTVRSSSLAVADGKVVLTNGKPTCTGCDETLLAQRAAFLRPDSLVAIVMLSDENDCSIRDDGVGWFVATTLDVKNNTVHMPRATAACDANPNDPCCRSCAQIETSPPKGCAALSADEVCKTVPAGQTYATWNTPGGDSPNLRCYNQRRRFGFDLLYETSRYVSALTETTLLLQSQLEKGNQVSVANPLYETAGSAKAPRDPSLVFLAGIVGVPWQDIADDASLSGPGLTYLTAQQLSDKNRWTDLLGEPDGTVAGGPPVAPADPFMVETTEVRAGKNPIAGVSIVAADSMNPVANAINGHEQKIPGFDDLQYACTFKLKTPKTCMPNDGACDCSPNAAGNAQGVIAANSPLCQPPGGGAATTTQSYAKAYPGARELQVLKDLHSNAIVASICPKVLTSSDPANPANDPNYGYNPAVGAIIERLKEALKGKCLPRPIETDTDVDSPTKGQVLCKVIEAQASSCDCGLPGRTASDPKILGPVRAQLLSLGKCSEKGDDGLPACSTWCGCEIQQLTGDDLRVCQATGGNKPGYCYVDAAAEQTNPNGAAAIQQQLAKCPATQQQLLRFVDADTVKTLIQNAVAFIACLGAPVVQAATGGGGGT